MTEFAVTFLASPMDGNRPHIHQITDFRPYDNNVEPITLTTDNSLSVNGTADIKINGLLVWDNADVSISISKGNTFIFDPDDVDTENHFGDQQVEQKYLHNLHYLHSCQFEREIGVLWWSICNACRKYRYCYILDIVLGSNYF